MAADEPTPMPAQPAAQDPADLEEEQNSSRRSLWGLVPILVGIVIVIVVLLLLRSCGGTQAADDGGRDKTIEDVAGLEPVAGVVSLWVSEDASLDGVLAAAGVSAENSLDLGGGRYVLDVAAGSEQAAVAALEKTAGVNDAGRVFEER